ncbi:putative extracellular protein TR9_065 [Pycnococcus provasolii]
MALSLFLCLLVLSYSPSALAQLQFETSAGASFQLDAKGCVSKYAEKTNYFPDERRLVATGDATVDGNKGTTSTVTVAEDFSVQYFDTFKVLRNHKDNKTYVLHQCGTPEITKDLLPEHAKDAPVFSTPVQAWSTALTTPLDFLDMLGLNHLADVVDMTYVTSPCLHRLAKCSSKDEFGHTHIASSDAGFKANITEGDSEVHFTDYRGTGKTESSKDVSFDATSDPGILNRAEWVKFVAVFFNAEPLANTVFDGIQRRLNDVSKLSKGDNASPKQVAFVAYNAEYKSETNPEWNSPASWVIDNAAYKMDTIKLAGATAYSEDKKQSFPNATGVKEALKGVDCVIDETYAPDPRTYNVTHFLAKFDLELEGADLSDYPFLANKCVIRLDKRLGETKWGVGMDWYESAVGHPDIVVKDLVSLIHDGAVSADYKTRYMRNIAKGEVPFVTSPEDCEDPESVCTKAGHDDDHDHDHDHTTTKAIAHSDHDDDHDHDHDHDHTTTTTAAAKPTTTAAAAAKPTTTTKTTEKSSSVRVSPFVFVAGAAVVALLQ